MRTFLFILLSSLLVSAVVATLVRPLWRQAAGVTSVRLRRAHRRALKQLDRALRAGAIDASLHATQRQHLQAELAQALSSCQPSGAPVPSQSVRRSVGVIAIGVPLLVGALYWQLGDFEAIEPSVRAQTTLPSVDQMVDGLARKLTANPNDLQGWELLGRSYMVLGRYGPASQALAHAHRLAATDPQVALDYAEALAMQAPAALTGEAAPLIEGALAASPTNPKGLWLGGLLAQARQDSALAAQRWKLLLVQSGLDADLRRAVEQHLQALGAPYADSTLGATAVTRNPPASTDATPSAADAVGDEPRGGVEVRITLASALKRTLPTNAALFVFARPLGQSSGPPLAVRRLAVTALPAAVHLSAADSMITGAAMDAHTPLQITARVMLHGGVTAQAGDLEGQASYHGDGRPVTLSIDRVLR